MKVLFNDVEYSVKDLSYQEKRKLWHKSIIVMSDEDNIDQELYFGMMDEVEKLAGIKEKDLVDKNGDPLNMGEIDLLMQEVFQNYMGLKKKKQIELSTLVWFSQNGFPYSKLEFPYVRRSLVSDQNITFNNLDAVWKEVYLLVESWKDSKFSLGRNLYFHLPLFCNPRWLVNDHDGIVLKEYMWNKELKIPLGSSLDEMNSRLLDLYDHIGMEINSLKKYLSEK